MFNIIHPSIHNELTLAIDIIYYNDENVCLPCTQDIDTSQLYYRIAVFHLYNVGIEELLQGSLVNKNLQVTFPSAHFLTSSSFVPVYG